MSSCSGIARTGARAGRVVDVHSFLAHFGSHDDCLRHIAWVRWGEGLHRFSCPACQAGRGWWLSRRPLVECADCGRQTSPTAGTLLHRARTDLRKWLWAIYQMAHDKKGIAAKELSKQIRVTYKTAWFMLQKIREAMRRENERSCMLRGLVEVKISRMTWSERSGPRADVPVALALELSEGRPGRVAAAVVRRHDVRCYKNFVTSWISRGSTLKAERWGRHAIVAKCGYACVRDAANRSAIDPEREETTLAWAHVFVGNLRRVILGTYHSVAAKHLDRYLGAFVFRANRRWREGALFDLLLDVVVGCKVVTANELVT